MGGGWPAFSCPLTTLFHSFLERGTARKRLLWRERAEGTRRHRGRNLVGNSSSGRGGSGSDSRNFVRFLVALSFSLCLGASLGCPVLSGFPIVRSLLPRCGATCQGVSVGYSGFPPLSPSSSLHQHAARYHLASCSEPRTTPNIAQKEGKSVRFWRVLAFSAFLPSFLGWSYSRTWCLFSA